MYLEAEFRKSQIQQIKEPMPRLPIILRYGIAILSVVAATIILLLTNTNIIGDGPYVSLFLCAVIVSTLIGGLKPGLLSVVLSILAFDYYFLPPGHSFGMKTSQLPRLLLFMVPALFIIWLSAAQKSVTELLQHARNALEATVQKLGQTNTALHEEIVERKHAEDALRKSEDHLRLVTDTIPALVWSASPDGSIDFINQRHKEFTGLSLEDVCDWRWIDIIHPDDREGIVREWRRSLATSEALKTEARMRMANGEYRCLMINALPLRDESGKIVKWYGTKTDITERKEAEDALRRSEDSIRLIIDTIPIMAWSLRPDGIVDFLNQGWLEYTGIALEEYIKEPMGPVHPEDVPRVIEKWRINKAAEKAFDDEIRLRRADGEYRWFLVRTAPFHDKQGNIVKWYGVSIDIEDSKRAEDKLRLAYQRLSYHVENTPLAIIELDKDLFITRWSKRAEEIFRWNTSEALGKNVYDPDFRIIYPEDIPAVDKINEELTKGTVNKNLSLNRNYTKDGNVIYCEWYNSVLKDEHGNVITILSLVHNVTERKKTEETLQQSYEEISRLTEHLQNIREEERTSIAREIHDELGQQLTAIKMDVAWIDKRIPKESTEEKRKLKNIIGMLNESNQSIRRILSELRPRILDDHGWLEAIEWLGRQFSETTGIPAKFKMPEKDVKVSNQLATSIFRIFQEAFTNITRHAQAKNVSYSIDIIEENIVSIIEDDGVGFDISSVQNNKSYGILGIKERVRALGGKFELVSSQGKGTRIIVSLPCSG